MPRVEMLAASGFPAAQAEALGHTMALDLTATGSTQSDALQLSAVINVFTSVALNTGCKLPAVDTWKAGWIAISNATGNPIFVYPAVGEYIYTHPVNVQAECPFITEAGTSADGGAGLILYCGIRSNGNRTWCIISGY